MSEETSDPFAFIEVQVADCETANPEPIVFTHQLPPTANSAPTTTTATHRSGGGMVPPTDSEDDSSLSGSCSTDDDDAKAMVVLPTHPSPAPTRGTANRSSRYAAYQQEGDNVVTTSTTSVLPEPSSVEVAVREEDIVNSGLVSLDDLPDPTPPQDPTIDNPDTTTTTTPFERAPLDASKLTLDERRKMSVEEQKAKEEAATLMRCAELLVTTTTTSHRPTPAATAVAHDDALHLANKEEVLVGPDAHYSSPQNESLPAEVLLDTSRFNEGVPMEVRDGCKGALEAIMAAYR